MALQIDELGAADRGVLRQAAVMGVRFTRAALVGALELDEAAAEAILERLDGFLLSDGEGGLAFRHGLLRDAAYHGLSFRRRRVLHRRVADSLELSAGADVADVAADLTHHYYEAGAWGKALRYGLVAGSQARAVYANVDAAAVLDRAVAAAVKWRAARPETVMLAAEALGDVRLALGEFERARAAFALARRRIRGDAVERARLLRKEGIVAYRLAAYPRAIRILTDALVALEGTSSAPATAQRASIEALLGTITLWMGAPRESVGVADARHHGRRGSRQRGGAGPRARRPRPRLQRARRRAAGDPQPAGARALPRARRPRQPGRRAQQPGLDRVLRRPLERGARPLPAGVAAWDQAGDTRSVSTASFNIGEILSAQGRLEEAEPLLREAERASRAAGGASDIAESLMETALLEARRGNVARALAQLEDARLLLEESGNRTATLLADARLAEALQLGGEYDRAAELAARTLEHAAGDEGSSLIRPVLNRVLGQSHLLAGRLDAARDALEAAIEEANRVEHRYEEALALAALSRIGSASSEASRRRDALFEQLGIVALPGRWEHVEE